jgi:hypothetical protein
MLANFMIMLSVVAVIAVFVFFVTRKKEKYSSHFTTVKGRILNISSDYKRFQIIFWRRCNGRKIRTKYMFNTINPRWQYKKRDIVKVSYRNWGQCEPAGFL